MLWIVDVLLILALVVIVLYQTRELGQLEQRLMQERSELLNRIKPETAQIPNVSTMEMVEPIRSDEDYWSAHESQLKDDGSYPYGFDEEIKGR